MQKLRSSDECSTEPWCREPVLIRIVKHCGDLGPSVSHALHVSSHLSWRVP